MSATSTLVAERASLKIGLWLWVETGEPLCNGYLESGVARSQVENFENLDGAFRNIRKHPFTLISLSDREKFHTGMLAFTINQIDASVRPALLNALWGGEETDYGAFERQPGPLAFVEEKSVDLVVKLGGTIQLWAEVKFKTTLSDNQLEKYQSKLPPGAIGALFALFTGVEDIPVGFQEIAFHKRIVDQKMKILEGLTDPDSRTLVRLWIEYLENIAILTEYLASCGTRPIIYSGFSNQLGELKLRGVFEHYRYCLLRRLIADRYQIAGRLKVPRTSQFNSHGNAAIEHFFVEDEEDKAVPDSRHLSFGLQLQAGALKLFVVAKGGRDLEKRDQRLKLLLDRVGFIRTKSKSANAEFLSETIERELNVFTSDLCDLASVYCRYLDKIRSVAG